MNVTIDSDAVLWSAPESERASRPLLLLLHGVGSHEGDLFSMASYLPLEPVIASLRAPLPYGPGHGWFPMPEQAPDAARWQSAAASTQAIIDWLDTTQSTTVGLLGFSQGAAMSLELLRARPERFAFAVALSGFAIPEEREGDERLAEVRPPVFWGRGTADPIFTEDRLEFTKSWLPEHSTLTQKVYPGLGHGISQEELGDIVAFLRERY